MTAPVPPGLDAVEWKGAETGSFHWFGIAESGVIREARWCGQVFGWNNTLRTFEEIQERGWTYLGQVPTQAEHAALTQRIRLLEALIVAERAERKAATELARSEVSIEKTARLLNAWRDARAAANKARAAVE